MNKDIEWANGEIEKLRDLLNNKRYEEEVDDFTTGVLSGLNKALSILDQLDEPETLSAYWIEQKSIETYVDTLSGDVQVTFKLDDLEKLLVPDIDELIEEHESRLIKSTPWTPNPLDFESEKTEVKNTEWLKEEIRNMPYTRLKQVGMEDYVAISKSGVFELINQLDETSILSQDWVKGHEQQVHPDHPSNTWWVPANDLQGLFVLRQGEVDQAYKDGYEKGKEHATKVIKPTIPKLVAEVIEKDKERGYDVYDSIDLIIETNGGGLPSLSDWVTRNINRYARAWLYGFILEKEQKYFAKIKGHENISSDDKYWNYCITDESLDIGDNKVHTDVLAEYVLSATKDEWENIGINDDNADFVEVEELEE